MVKKASFAIKLQELRGNRTRAEVASANNISISALQMYENGKRVPRDHIKVRLAKYYGVSVEYLFFENETHETCGETA